MKKFLFQPSKWFILFISLILLSSCQEQKELDDAVLKLNNQNILFMNLSLGFIMLGVALKLRIDDFKRVFSAPKSVIIGFVSQFLALPFLTFLLVLVFRVPWALSGS